MHTSKSFLLHMIKLLIRESVSLDVQDKDGKTASVHAFVQDNQVAALLLLHIGTNYQLQTKLSKGNLKEPGSLLRQLEARLQHNSSRITPGKIFKTTWTTFLIARQSWSAYRVWSSEHRCSFAVACAMRNYKMYRANRRTRTEPE